jgi:hypothetical protein
MFWQEDKDVMPVCIRSTTLREAEVLRMIYAATL